MSRVLVISDTHWGHLGITRFRPEFESREDHDKFLTDKITSEVKKRDVLWLLGDCFFDEASLVHLYSIRECVDQLHFIPGNHDTDKTERQELVRKMVKEDLVDKVGSMYKTSGFWLTHSPIHPRELWGKKNIHGHVHRKTVPDARYINVSAENVRYTPVNMQDLKDPEKCKRLLVHYGDYDHDCEDFSGGFDGECLVCSGLKEN